MADDAGYATAAAAFDPIGQQSAAAAYMQKLAVQRATMQAGQAISQGDYAGASAAIAPYDNAQGQTLQRAAAMQTGLTAATQGDLAGARAAGAATGDAGSYGQLDTAATTNLSDHAKFFLKTFDTLQGNGTKQLPGIPAAPGDATGDPNTPRGQAVQHLISSGVFHMMGLTPQQVDQMATSPRDDATINQTRQQLTTPFTGAVTGDGGVQTHYTNGQIDATGYKAPVALSEGQGLHDQDTGTLLGTSQPVRAQPVTTTADQVTRPFFPSGNGPQGGVAGAGNAGGPSGVSSIHTPGGPATSPNAGGVPVGAPGTRAATDHNPLNVSNLPNGQKWNAQTGVDGQYSTFPTDADGFAAADRNLQSYSQLHGINTLAGIVSRWAPAGSNNTASYIATVSKTLGVDPSQPLNLQDAGVRKAVLTAMAHVESNASVPSQTSAPAPLGPQPAQGPGAAYGASIGATAPPPAANNYVGAPTNTAQGVRPLTPQELQARGFAPGTVAMLKPGGDVEVKQTPQAAGLNSSQDKATVGTLQKEAQRTANINSLAQAFVKLNQKSGTGIQYTPFEVPVPFAHQAVNINPTEALERQFDPNVVAMESITQRAAPQLRPEGSGRLQAQEYQNFIKAFPNLENTPQANQLIAQQLAQEHAVAQAKSNFYTNFLEKNKTLAGADQAWANSQPASSTPAPAAPP